MIESKPRWLKYVKSKGFMCKDGEDGEPYPIPMWKLTPYERDLAISKKGLWVELR